jgi:hypothetical protein
MPESPIDVDDPRTWPERLDTRYENGLRQGLRGQLVRAYHCTRLLDHERDMIQKQGLRALTPELVHERIEAARAHGYLSAAQREQLIRTNVFASGNHGQVEIRAEQVALFVSLRSLEEVPDAYAPLLSEWGGEAIQMAAGAAELGPRISGLGQPAVVVVHVDLGATGPEFWAHPPLHSVFQRALLGRRDADCDLFYHGSIPPEQVVTIWQPGDPRYDRFGGLPRY